MAHHDLPNRAASSSVSVTANSLTRSSSSRAVHNRPALFRRWVLRTLRTASSRGDDREGHRQSPAACEPPVRLRRCGRPGRSGPVALLDGAVRIAGFDGSRNSLTEQEVSWHCGKARSIWSLQRNSRSSSRSSFPFRHGPLPVSEHRGKSHSPESAVASQGTSSRAGRGVISDRPDLPLMWPGPSHRRPGNPSRSWFTEEKVTRSAEKASPRPHAERALPQRPSPHVLTRGGDIAIMAVCSSPRCRSLRSRCSITGSVHFMIDQA